MSQKASCVSANWQYTHTFACLLMNLEALKVCVGMKGDRDGRHTMQVLSRVCICAARCWADIADAIISLVVARIGGYIVSRLKLSVEAKGVQTYKHTAENEVIRSMGQRVEFSAHNRVVQMAALVRSSSKCSRTRQSDKRHTHATAAAHLMRSEDSIECNNSTAPIIGTSTAAKLV